MKKIFIVVLLLCFCCGFPIISGNASKQIVNNDEYVSMGNESFQFQINKDFKITTEKNYKFLSEQFIVYGNYSSFEEVELKKITQNSNITSIFYDLDLNDNINKNLEIMTNHSVIYFYNNGIPNVCSFRSSTSDINILKGEIYNFIIENLEKIKKLLINIPL